MATAANQIDIRKVILQSASGRQVDLTYIFTQIMIHESMYMTSVNGSVTVEDEHEHFEILPIIGQENLRLEVEVLDESYVLEFRVYKLGEVKKLSPSKTQYVLYFASHEMLTNEKNRLSKAFANQKYSTMVRDILTNDIGTSKNIAIATTENEDTHIVPNLRPFNAINQILRKSVAESNGASNYVFFEGIRGYIAVPLSSFVRERTKFTYKYVSRVGPDAPNQYITDPFAILNLDMKQQSDVLDLTSKGLFGSQLHSIDLLQRKVDVYEYNYFDLFDEMDHLNRYKEYFDTEEFDVEGQQYFTYSTETAHENAYVADNYSDFVPDMSSRFRLTRMLQNLMFSNYVINMSITGNVMLNIGDIIEIDLISAANMNEENKHRTISGRSMVTAITHLMNQGRSYMQRVETVKDSLAQDLGDTV